MTFTCCRHYFAPATFFLAFAAALSGCLFRITPVAAPSFVATRFCSPWHGGTARLVRRLQRMRFAVWLFGCVL